MAHEAVKAQGVGYGAGEEKGPVVDVDEVGRDSLKTVNLPATETVDVGDKGGSDMCPEGATGNDHEESQVAKKPRTEKDVNGVGAGKGGLEMSGYGVSGDGDLAEKPAADFVGKPSDVDGIEAHEPEQATADVADKSEDQDKEINAGDVHAEKSKADGQGEVGLRSLLQEGDTNSSVLNSDVGDATHMVNGAKAS